MNNRLKFFSIILLALAGFSSHAESGLTLHIDTVKKELYFTGGVSGQTGKLFNSNSATWASKDWMWNHPSGDGPGGAVLPATDGRQLVFLVSGKNSFMFMLLATETNDTTFYVKATAQKIKYDKYWLNTIETSGLSVFDLDGTTLPISIGTGAMPIRIVVDEALSGLSPSELETNWSKIKNNLKFNNNTLRLPFNMSERTEIMSEFKRVFLGSETARRNLNAYFDEGNKLVLQRSTFEKGSNHKAAFPTQINIDMNDRKKHWISSTGEIMRPDLGLIVYHEFLHVYDEVFGNELPQVENQKLKITFNDPKYDYIGSVVSRVNEVRRELGIAERGSYKSGIPCEVDEPETNCNELNYFNSLSSRPIGHYDQVIWFIAPPEKKGDPLPSEIQEFSSVGSGRRSLVIALNSQNKVMTGALNDKIFGFENNDILSAGAGDDYIMGIGGNDRIDGGLGHDVASFTGNASDYDIYFNTDKYLIVEHVGGSKYDGKDTLKGIEALRFKDVYVQVGDIPDSVPTIPKVIEASSIDSLRLATPNFFQGGKFNWSNVIFEADTFVAVGGVRIGANDKGQIIFSPVIAYSKDGLAWSLGKIENGNSQGALLLDVTYGAGTFVAVGFEGTIITSADGINWQVQYSDFQLQDRLMSVTFGKDAFVATGAGFSDKNKGRLAYKSLDKGKTWQSIFSTYQEIWLNSVKFINGEFIVVGDFEYTLTSPDLTHWSRNSLKNIGRQHKDITFGNQTYALLSLLPNPTDEQRKSGFLGSFAISKDGKVWVNSKSDGITWPETIHYVRNQFVALGNGGDLFSSENGETWEKVEMPRHVIFQGIAYGAGRYVVVGRSFGTGQQFAKRGGFFLTSN